MRFVHLAPASSERSITRAGVRGVKSTILGESAPIVLRRAVFAMPIVTDFWTTYQWLRELRRAHDERMLAVQFVVADEEAVYVGRYNQPHRASSAAQAA